MDSAALHDMVTTITGKDSIRVLSKKEGADGIDELVRADAKVKRKRTPRRELPPSVVELLTPKQRRFIKYLTRRLGWHNDPERLRSFLNRTIRRDAIRTKQEAIKVIEGLNAIADRQHRGFSVSGRAL
jgi:hypothetical protein